MKTHLHIIVDVSGSMKEMGKIHLQRNLCRCAAQLRLIDQEKFSSADILFFQWAKNISRIALETTGDIPVLNAAGSSNLCVLSNFLSQHMNDKGRSMFLILSDGNLPNSDIASFRKKLSKFTDLIIRTVAIGADANTLKLKKISTNNTVYFSENIASAIDNTIFGSDETLTAPVSMAQILQAAPTEPEDDWDA